MADRLADRARALLPLGTAARGRARADRRTSARRSPSWPSGCATPTRTPTRATPARCSSRRRAVAWAAYATAMLLNPNNHALDGGPATAEMEKEAVAQIADDVRLRAAPRAPDRLGHDRQPRGALGRARAAPGRARSSRARTRTTRTRACPPCIGARHETVPAGRARADRPRRARGAAARGRRRHGRRDAGHDRASARSTTSPRSPTCARSTARGCTSTPPTAGSSRARCADGARRAGVAAAPFAAIARADSIVVDPHKHGLQPYGCGCVLFADPGVGRLYAHDSPYTYFTSDDLHLGEISLECSRAGAAAAALWTTLRALPLTRAGLGRHLAAARAAALAARRGARATTRAPRSLLEPETRHRLRAAGRRLGRRDQRRRRARLRHARRRRLARREAARRHRLAAPHPPARRARRARRHRPALLPAQAGARRRRARARGRRSPPTSTPRGSPHEAPVPPGRRVRPHALRRQPRRRRARRAGPLDGGDAALRALDEPVRDHLRAPAARPVRRLPRADLHPGGRAAVRRPPDARHLPRLGRAHRQRCRPLHPGVRRRPDHRPPDGRRARVRRPAAPPRGAGRGRARRARRRDPRPRARRDRRPRLGGQRPGLDRRPARQRRRGARDRAGVRRPRRRRRRSAPAGRRARVGGARLLPEGRRDGRGPGHGQPQRVARDVAARQRPRDRRPTSRARGPRSAATAAST